MKHQTRKQKQPGEKIRGKTRENFLVSAKFLLLFFSGNLLFSLGTLKGKSFKGFKVSAVAWSAKRAFLRRSDLERERERIRS